MRLNNTSSDGCSSINSNSSCGDGSVHVHVHVTCAWLKVKSSDCIEKKPKKLNRRHTREVIV